VTQWTDMTFSVPLKLIDDCVSFTSVVSARYQSVTLSHLCHQLAPEAWCRVGGYGEGVPFRTGNEL